MCNTSPLVPRQDLSLAQLLHAGSGKASIEDASLQPNELCPGWVVFGCCCLGCGRFAQGPREFPLEGRLGPVGPLPGSGRAGDTCCREWLARLRLQIAGFCVWGFGCRAHSPTKSLLVSDPVIDLGQKKPQRKRKRKIACHVKPF